MASPFGAGRSVIAPCERNVDSEGRQARCHLFVIALGQTEGRWLGDVCRGRLWQRPDVKQHHVAVSVEGVMFLDALPQLRADMAEVEDEDIVECVHRRHLERTVVIAHAKDGACPA